MVVPGVSSTAAPRALSMVVPGALSTGVLGALSMGVPGAVLGAVGTHSP